jgi:hypothetical protein
MSEHTKGPWVVRESKETDDGFAIIGPRIGCQMNGVKNKWQLATVGNDAFWDEKKFKAEDRANAKLIACAPELLAVALSLANIEKLSKRDIENGAFKDELSAIVKAAKAALAKATGKAEQ